MSRLNRKVRMKLIVKSMKKEPFLKIGTLKYFSTQNRREMFVGASEVL